MSNTKIILASESKYRAAQLSQLQLEFSQLPSKIDESPLEGELPPDTARRLARDKHKICSEQNPQAIIISADQVGAVGLTLLTKPVSVDNAKSQLKLMSGSKAIFYSAACVGTAEQTIEFMVETQVLFRNLSEIEIDRYIKKENVLNCAGSFQVENLGISLFEYVRSDDPSALVGLPLIGTSKALRQFGISLP